VKGIGDKVFVQCAGFIRIRRSGSAIPPSADRKKTASTADSTNPLDATSIHPESYSAAGSLIYAAGCALSELGSAEFGRRIGAYAAQREPAALAAELGVGLPTLQLMLDALTKPLEHDLREEFAEPLFRSGLTRLEDVSPGSQLTGRVSNVTDFGAFVDVGLGRDGLLHIR
jgi:transcriptional accessory protein Tex/SPT6